MNCMCASLMCLYKILVLFDLLGFEDLINTFRNSAFCSLWCWLCCCVVCLFLSCLVLFCLSMSGVNASWENIEKYQKGNKTFHLLMNFFKAEARTSLSFLFAFPTSPDPIKTHGPGLAACRKRVLWAETRLETQQKSNGCGGLMS